MKRTVIDTEDNSKTLLINNSEVTYHSRHGAKTESNHIFIENGLKYFDPKKSLSVFEMGFGTGLNALLSAEYSIKNNTNITYHSIEKYPLTAEEVSALKTSYAFNIKELEILYDKMHNSEWEIDHLASDKFILRKIKSDILKYNLGTSTYDIVFFDAFGPKFQPDLWKVNVLKNIFNSLKNDGVLITYCAQGQFKRDLKSVGFEIENLPGPPGKREITRAIKRPI